jgi:hypothetical protein
LLSAEEWDFEGALGDLPAAGLFRGTPFSYRPLILHVPKGQDEFSIPNRECRARIQKNLDEMSVDRGLTGSQLERQRLRQEQQRERLRLREQAYIGWLVTAPDFRGDLHALRTTWSDLVAKPSEFPGLLQEAFGISLSPAAPAIREFRDAFGLLYRTWNLEALATWDLPVPLQSQMGFPTLNSPTALDSELGAALFIPWYMLVDKNLKVEELVQWQLQAINSPIKNWTSKSKPSRMGLARYADILHLYVYLELGLRQRYGPDLRGQTEKVDTAFARFLRSAKNKGANVAGEESIRKIRLYMDRQLAKCRDQQNAEEVIP